MVFYTYVQIVIINRYREWNGTKLNAYEEGDCIPELVEKNINGGNKGMWAKLLGNNKYITNF